MRKTLLIIGITALAVSANGADLFVDSTGAGGAYTTIGAAMSAANPGDRILVFPGSYPYYEHHVGVPVIGLGSRPSEVVVRRIYFHVNNPTVGYEAAIQNLTVHSEDPGDVLGIHGNEAGPGSLVIDGVRVLGAGVFVRGGEEGFYLQISNCTIEPRPGYGFDGEACFVGGPGNYTEIRNSKITGWNATPAEFAVAGIGLRLFGGTKARINGSVITGGDGAVQASYEQGGAAVYYGGLGDIDLRIDGGSRIAGGDGVGARGGDGVSIPGTIALGAAEVSGGDGVPPGDDFGIAQPSRMPRDLNLAITPNLLYAEGDTFIQSGDTLGFNVDASGSLAVIALSFGVHVPQTHFFPLAPSSLTLLAGSGFSLTVPTVQGLSLTGLLVFGEGLVQEPLTGRILFTNSAVIRVDLL